MLRNRLSLWNLWIAGLCVFAAQVVGNPSWGAEGEAAAVPESTKSAIKSLRVEPNPSEKGVLMRGKDARQQFFVTGELENGRLKDLTRNVKYSAAPEGILSVDATGMTTPLADGEAVITAEAEGGLKGTLNVTVTGFQHEIPIDFKNQIVPVFTKLGCNGGGCHGKASGQNGFKLSLLGFYPDDDYEFLVKEGRGRRLFPSAPGKSLLLTKAVGTSPHGGGKRMEIGSYEYRLIARWIEQGMPATKKDAPSVASIKCYPEGRVMDRKDAQQVTVLATYTDGTIEDVTRMALYEPNDQELAEVNTSALVKTSEMAGEVAVMARYQGQVSTFRATIPLGIEVKDLPAPKNFVDEAIANKLRLLGIPPSAIADDSTFLRRVYLDVIGKLPSESEVRAFLADTDPVKRDKMVDRLVDSPEYADFFANKWNFVLRNKKRTPADLAGTFAMHQWIRNALYENKPYDQFVRDVLTASGDYETNPPVVWFREVTQANEQVEDTAQLFLGLRIQCARCHHHPFEKWSQDDYYGMAAFFSRVGSKNGDGRNPRDKRVFHNDGVASAQNPKSGKNLPPTGLAAAPSVVPADRDPRQYLVDWMADKQNPFFAKSLVNRYWKHFFDRGIVEPEDDMRETNPPSNPELLNKLAEHFISTGFDMKDLVRTICKSNTYQLSALPNEYNLKDKQNFSRYYPRRLRAEPLYDALHQVTGTVENYGGLPGGTTAVQLADSSTGPYFLKVFGQPQGDTACECERSQEANLAQSLHLLNSPEVQGKIGAATGRAVTMAKDTTRTDDEKVKELYRWVFSREPQGDELQIAISHINKNAANKQVAYEDVIWALVNTKEFLFNH